jgi:MFS family permease
MGFARTTEDRPTPPEVYGWRIYALTLLTCLGSWMFGYNVGVIGGCIVLPSFHSDFRLPETGTTSYNNISSNIVSMLQIGGLVGSLSMFPIMSRWGRKMALSFAAAVYLVGAIMQVRVATIGIRIKNSSLICDCRN